MDDTTSRTSVGEEPKTVNDDLFDEALDRRPGATDVCGTIPGPVDCVHH